MSHVDAATIGAEIERRVQELSALGDSPAKAQAQDLVRLLMSLYGAGLSRILEIIRTEGAGPQAVLDRLATDPLLASLLVLHDLHPQPVEVRVQRALTGLQPHLPGSTRVMFVAADGDSVRVTVEQPGAGQAQAGGTIRLAIERAIQEAAPEVATIHIEGLDDPLIQIVRSSRASAAR